MLGCLPKIRDNMELRHSNNEGLTGSVEEVSSRLDCCHNVGRCERVENRDKKIEVLTLVPAFSRDTAIVETWQ